MVNQNMAQTKRIQVLSNHLTNSVVDSDSNVDSNEDIATTHSADEWLMRHLYVNEASNNNKKKKKTYFKDKDQDKFSLNSSDLFSVKNKIALVTGGSKGIGRMISAGFVANGCKVYICARNKELCETTSKEINELYGSLNGAIIPIDGGQHLFA